MFTYQLQQRGLRIEGEAQPVFPADLEVEVKLGPPQPFGAGKGPCRTAIRAVPATTVYNANTGRATIESERPLEPVDVRVEGDGGVFTMRGDVLSISTRVETPRALHNALTFFMFSVPVLLNVEILDAPHILHVRGTVGGVPFSWELAGADFSFDLTTTDYQSERIRKAVRRIDMVSGDRNRQIMAALHYFHKACRLLASGDSPWEFMAEALLNFAKVLQALFGESRDEVRAGLSSLGYPEPDAEKYFVAAMALRAEIDVGHVMTSVLRQSDLRVLYKYLSGAEMAFRQLLQKVLNETAAGRLSFPEIPDLIADADKRRVVERIIAAWSGEDTRSAQDSAQNDRIAE
jgi:hypothetical protein